MIAIPSNARTNSYTFYLHAPIMANNYSEHNSRFFCLLLWALKIQERRELIHSYTCSFSVWRMECSPFLCQNSNMFKYWPVAEYCTCTRTEQGLQRENWWDLLAGSTRHEGSPAPVSRFLSALKMQEIFLLPEERKSKQNEWLSGSTSLFCSGFPKKYTQWHYGQRVIWKSRYPSIRLLWYLGKYLMACYQEKIFGGLGHWLSAFYLLPNTW